MRSAALVELPGPVWRLCGMWRSVAIGMGIALTGVLAGCSVGGSQARTPSGGAVGAVVRHMVPTPQATCHVIGRRARCDVALVRPGPFAGGVPIDRVWFKLSHASDGWLVAPDCSANRKDVLCRKLQRQARTVGYVIPG
jgi:hypothetical protein